MKPPRPTGAWLVSDETSKPLPIWRGTESSNPSPSSGESANHQFRDDFTGSTSRYPALDAPPTSFTQKPDALRDGKERFEQRVAELFEFALRPDLRLTGAASSDLLEIGEFDLERYGAAAKSGVLAVPPHLIHDPSKRLARGFVGEEIGGKVLSAPTVIAKWRGFGPPSQQPDPPQQPQRRRRRNTPVELREEAAPGWETSPTPLPFGLGRPPSS